MQKFENNGYILKASLGSFSILYNRQQYYIQTLEKKYKQFVKYKLDKIKVMKQNMSLGMNRSSSIHKGVPKYSDKYKDVLERAAKRNQIYKPKLKQLFFYRIRSIGVGAFSFVYLVSQETTGTIFAQKSISKKSIAPELFTEIKMHLSLRHENIVNLYHIYSQQSYVQLIMDFAGESLFTLRKNYKLPSIMSQQQIIFILKQLIKAVSYLHSRNIVHADIKLQNILYMEGVVKLCDFGYAHLAKKQQIQIRHKEREKDKDKDQEYYKLYTNKYKQKQFEKPWAENHNKYSKNYAGEKYSQNQQQYDIQKQNKPMIEQKQIFGTLQYLDPQYVQGKHSQYSRDIWAIGIVAYQLLMGKNPFQSMPQNQKWTNILKIKEIDLRNASFSISKRMQKFLQITLCPISKRATITQLENLQMFKHQQQEKNLIQPQDVRFFQS